MSTMDRRLPAPSTCALPHGVRQSVCDRFRITDRSASLKRQQMGTRTQAIALLRMPPRNISGHEHMSRRETSVARQRRVDLLDPGRDAALDVYGIAEPGPC